ncbi:ABC transporter permease [Cohaesibacter haloalkalitolerans]|uniref:ABC transporter permease n=1 Tax=Cohaesibacter haloalkalitolerans TaxID=1162980 RepID=UPI0019692F31|nr:ABC transporter permease [Cohaesibacter haloalkalitolerans]
METGTGRNDIMAPQGSDIATSGQPPLLQGDGTVADGTLHLSGDWTIDTLKEADQQVDSIVQSRSTFQKLNLSGLAMLDTSGAWVIIRLLRGLGLKMTDAEPIRADHKSLFEAVEETNKKQPQSTPQPGFLISALSQTGEDVVEIYNDVKILAYLTGEIVLCLLRSILNPRSLRITSIVHHMHQTGLKAVPIVALMSFLVGAIVAQQGAFQLRKFGAEPFVIDLVGILVLREVGILLTAILVAGRSGSAFTAEIGSMKMREEIDAMRVMGLNIIEVLIAPRVIALIIALPLLGLVANLAGLVGGGMLLWVYSDIAPTAYINWLREAVAINTFLVGVIKAPFMALIIALIACSEGLQVGGSAESLGRRTTAAVVKSIFLMVMVDGLFAIFFAAIGY